MLTFVLRTSSSVLTRSHPISVLDYWLAAFVQEARRKDGNYYPGNTIRNILAALFRFLKENAGVESAPNFIDRGQREATCNFPRLHNALDHHLKMLRNMGIGVEIHRASVITPTSYECSVSWEPILLRRF